MERSLLILGAGTYALLAYEIACDMGQFKKIDFADDQKSEAPTGDAIAGRISDLDSLSNLYTDAIVAIGNPDLRLQFLDKIAQETKLRVPTLISPQAYVAPSAKIAEGVIIEPLAVVHTLCDIRRGCLICAGAVINHESVLEEGVHVDCNATVSGYTTVPKKTKVSCGTVYKN